MNRATASLGLLIAVASSAVPAATPATPLRNLTADQIVQEIRYCRRQYTLTMANGEQHTYPEFNLRFKTDSSANGPESGKPVLLPAGMRGDRAFVIFRGLDDLKKFLVERCEGDRSS